MRKVVDEIGGKAKALVHAKKVISKEDNRYQSQYLQDKSTAAMLRKMP